MTERQTKLEDPADGEVQESRAKCKQGARISPTTRSSATTKPQGQAPLPLFLIKIMDPADLMRLSFSQVVSRPVRGTEPKDPISNVARSLRKTNINDNTRTRTIMNGHHIRFYASYSGKQPYDSEARIAPMKNWDKHIWERQTYTIVAGTKTIEIFLEHDGSLDTVKEKLDYCQETVERIGRVFAERHSIEYNTPFELSGHSHWVVDHRKTSQLLRPLCDQPGNEKTGAVYDDSSHPELTELMGPESAKGAVGMDGLLIDLPNMLNAWNRGHIQYRQDVTSLMGAIAENMKRQTETQKLQTETNQLLLRFLGKLEGK